MGLINGLILHQSYLVGLVSSVERGKKKWEKAILHFIFQKRWHNHLNPLIKKTPWEDREEWTLFLYHRAIGKKFEKIKFFFF